MGDTNSTTTLWLTTATDTEVQPVQTVTYAVLGHHDGQGSAVPVTTVTAGESTSSPASSLSSTASVPPATSSVTSTAGYIPVSNSTTTSLPSTPTITNEGASGISAGATAGIAIACVILGLVIGAIAASFLLRRRQNRRPKPEYVPMEYSPGKEKGLSAAAILPSATAGLSLDQYLLDSKPDTEIAGEMRNLSILIQQHVENKYHLRPVHQSSGTLSLALKNLGIPEIGQHNCNNLARLSIEPATRYFALQHVISKITFESVTVFGSGSVSLLPAFVSSFAGAIPPIEQHRGSSEAFLIAIIKWRQLSAFLLHPHRSDRTPLIPPEDVSTQQAQQLAIELNKFLEPFTIAGNRESHYEQENHLREVIVECATFGYLLFSQPSEFRFQWDNDRGHGGLVISPGLEKVTDEYGRQLSAPQRLVAPIIQDL